MECGIALPGYIPKFTENWLRRNQNPAIRKSECDSLRLSPCEDIQMFCSIHRKPHQVRAMPMVIEYSLVRALPEQQGVPLRLSGGVMITILGLTPAENA